MKILSVLTIVGGLMLLMLILYLGQLFVATEDPPAPTSETIVTATDGRATIELPADSGVSLTPLSPWQVIAFDSLKETYLGGFAITGPSDAFTEPVPFEMQVTPTFDGIPTLFREVSGIPLPVDDVSYVMVDGELTHVRTTVDGPGRVYLLQQHVFYGESALFALRVADIGDTAIGDTLNTSLNFSFRPDVGVYGATENKEYGYEIDPESVEVSVRMESRNASGSSESSDAIATFNSLNAAPATLQVMSDIECTRSTVVPVDVRVDVTYTANQYSRPVNDWVEQYHQPSDWSLVENSTNDRSFTLLSRQTPRCI